MRYSDQEYILIFVLFYFQRSNIHACPVCTLTFTSRVELSAHLTSHTDMTNHVCHLCCKLFRRNCDLRRHQLLHNHGNHGDVIKTDEHQLNVKGKCHKNTVSSHHSYRGNAYYTDSGRVNFLSRTKMYDVDNRDSEGESITSSASPPIIDVVA